MNYEKKYLVWLNILKGLAIILVVFGHTITVNLRTSNKGFMFVYFLVYFFHTRTLFYLSGYVIGFKKEKYFKEQTIVFIKNKFKRLMIPYIFILTITYVAIKVMCMNSMFNSLWIRFGFGDISTKDWLYGIISGDNALNKHLWYIYVLFILSIFIFFVLKKKINIKIVVFISLCLFLYQQFTNNDFFYVLNRCFDYGVFFIMGYYDKCNERKQRISVVNFFAIIYMFVFSYLKMKGVHGIYENPIMILFFSYKVIGTLICISKKVADKGIVSDVLNFLGKHSYSIYLFHHPFLSIGITTIILAMTQRFVFIVLLIITSICVILSLLIELMLNTKIFRKIKPFLLG